MSSLHITLNVLKRLLKEPITLIFLLVFPLIAGLAGMIMFDEPAIYRVGIDVNQNTQDVYNSLDQLNEYNLIPLSKIDIIAKIESEELDMGIVEGTDQYRYEIISKNGGEHVNTLKNQLLYYIDNKNIYTTDAQKGSSLNISISMYLIFMLTFIGTNSTILLNDRMKRTYMRLFSMPISTASIIFGYIFALFLAGVIQILWFLFVVTMLLNLQISIGIAQLFIVLAAFLLASIGLAIGLTSIVNTPEKYNVVIPAIAVISTFLSGGLIPINIFGKSVGYISNFIPQRWVVKALEQLNNGGDFTSILVNLGVLILFSLVFFTFGTKTLNKETL